MTTTTETAQEVACKNCSRTIVRCDSQPSHGGCSSACGWIHVTGWRHPCSLNGDRTFALPAETTQKAEAETEADEITEAAASLPIFQLPPPVADFGPVRLELMGHRYRQGHLSEVVIAGQPFLRLDLEGGAIEYYRPDAVYCITPGIIPPAPPRTAITSRFADAAWGDEGDDDHDEMGTY